MITYDYSNVSIAFTNWFNTGEGGNFVDYVNNLIIRSYGFYRNNTEFRINAYPYSWIGNAEIIIRGSNLHDYYGVINSILLEADGIGYISYSNLDLRSSNLEDFNFVSNLLNGSLNEKVIGSSYDDNYYGYYGDDILDGNAGNDQLSGGYGRDILYGDDGDDRIKLLGGITENELTFSYVVGHTRIKDDEGDLLAIVQNTVAADINFI